MGIVFRARDTKLDRDIAIKTLPEEFTRDADRLARFSREAKLLASLNHPNIAAIYGLEQSGGAPVLILELVEGDTLAERLKSGPIPVEESIRIALQIADALDAAHEKSVMHRDLKPANIKLTPEGQVKVLDFGLAKALSGDEANVNFSNSPTSPTMSAAATQQGIILGTAPYMSPEQARGKAVDKRTDVWAFGCVLYEMLTARRAFEGEDVSETLASVIKGAVDFDRIPAPIHPKLREVLIRCLQKDPKRRFRDIGDVRFELESVMADPRGALIQTQTAVNQTPMWRRMAPVVAAAIAVVAVAAAVMWTFRAPSERTGLTRFPFVLPEDQRLTRTGRHMVAISPDGNNIVYVANNQLYLRPMAEMESRPIQGTSLDVSTPVFSPDGQWIAFWTAAEGGKFKKVAITGGASVTICDSALPWGASWGPDDQILIGAGPAGIQRVSANGGKPETIVAVKAGEEAQGPQLLPGGDAVLFTLATGTAADRWDKAQILVHSLKSGERTVLIEGGSDARYLSTGHIVYALGTTLLAAPFDVKDLQVMGGPVPVIEGVLRFGLGIGAANVSFSDGGSMVYIPGNAGTFGTDKRLLALADRMGARKPLPLPPALYFHPRFSPDGKQLVVSTDDGKDVVVWVYDLADATAPRRLTFGGANRFPIWSRDGQRVIFQSDRDGDSGLFWQRADGSGTAERLTKAEEKTFHVANSWSPDGKTLTFSVVGSDPGIWSIAMEPDAKAKVLIDAPSSDQRDSSVSPDGRWITYHSTESGRTEIYVEPFPPTGAKYQITTTLGYLPVWSSDGKQIVYVQNTAGIGDIMSVDVQTQPSFVFGKPVPLPIKGIIQNGGQGNPRGYDISPDGKQFVVMLSASDAESGARQTQQIYAVLNWFEDLKRRVPVP